MMGFETLTLAPLHKALIDTSILSAQEIGYINAYHATVWETMKDRVRGEVHDWLEQACLAL